MFFLFEMRLFLFHCELSSKDRFFPDQAKIEKNMDESAVELSACMLDF